MFFVKSFRTKYINSKVEALPRKFSRDGYNYVHFKVNGWLIGL